jgi:LacI family transcriptional regulator
MKRVSLSDVAKQLNVSKTLVSLVLNGKGDHHGISKLTQAKVIEKANEMKYSPNQMARGLRLGKSGTIGLIVADIANPFYSKIARQIEDETNKKGYNLIICSSDEKDDKEIRLLRMLRDRQVDGLIVSSTLKRHAPFADLKKLDYPVVLIDRDLPKAEVPTVLVDNYKGAYGMTNHLIDSGHKRIAYLSISPNYLSTIRDRVRGYKHALKDRGIRIQPGWVTEVPFDNVAAAVDEAIPLLLGQHRKITALFTANNNLAVAAMDTMRKLNLKIPEDMAICSFDDVDLFRFCDPPVTACAQPADLIAHEAVKLLMQMIAKEIPINNPEYVILDTQLNVRPSTLKVSK